MTSRHTRISGLIAVLIAAPLASPLVAQGVSAQLPGSIQSASGQAVAEATVVIRNSETGFTRTIQTDAGGRFLATALPVGPYTVSVTKAGFHTASNIKINLNLGDAAPLTVKLAPESSTTVEVVAAISQVDSDRSAAATYVSPEALGALPTNGRRWENFALLTPQVTISSRGDLAIGGQRGVNTAVNVDGGNYNSSFFGGTLGSEAAGTPFTISSEAIREFQVVTDGASAEFGRNGGGYLNAITKSGTNEFAGGLFYYQRPQSLVAKRHSNGLEVSDFSNKQFGASVGGPILKDKLFYFISVDLQRDTRPNTVRFGSSASSPVALDPTLAGHAALIARSGGYTTRNDQTSIFGRFDWIVNQDHALQFRINRSAFTGDNNTGFNRAYSATALEEGKTLTVTAQWNWTLGPNWMNEFRLNRVTEQLPRTRRSDTPQVDIRDVGQYGEALFTREFESKQFQISNILTYVTPEWQFRGGVEYIAYDIFETFTPRAGGVYSFSSLANFRDGNWSDYRQFFSLVPGVSVEQAGTMDEKEKELGAFIQADWRPSQSWRFGLGIRYDRQEHPGFGIAAFDERNYATFPKPNPLTGRIPTDSSVSPRFSFTWTPQGDEGRTVVRGSAGLYVSRTPSVFNYQVLTSNGVRAAEIRFGSVTPALAAAYPNFVRGSSFNYSNPYQFAAYDAVNFTTAPPQIQSFHPDFKNPRTTRLNLGVDRAFTQGFTFGASLTYAKGTNLERITDLNLRLKGLNSVGRPVYDNTSANLDAPSATMVRPNASYASMQLYKSDAESTYQALTLSAKYAPEGSWINGQLFYTFARERDNDSNERSFSGYTTQDTNNLDGDFSWSNNDRRHVVTGYVNVHEKWFSGVNFGFNLRYLSGTPYNPTFNTGPNGPPPTNTPAARGDRNADGNFSDRVWGTERNSYREPSRILVDLKLSRDWKLAQRYRFEVSAEVFNLFNKVVRYSRTTGFATKFAPVGSLPTIHETDFTTNTALNTLTTERQVQLGARFSF